MKFHLFVSDVANYGKDPGRTNENVLGEFYLEKYFVGLDYLESCTFDKPLSNKCKQEF